MMFARTRFGIRRGMLGILNVGVAMSPVTLTLTLSHRGRGDCCPAGHPPAFAALRVPLRFSKGDGVR